MPNIDRSPDSFPASSFNRFNYGVPTPMRRAPENFKAGLKKAIEDPGKTAGEKKRAADLLNALPRLNRFCGGMSKPYKRK